MISSHSLDHISRQWRSKVDETHDYAVIDHDSVFRAGLCGSSLFRSEYDRLLEYRDQLSRESYGCTVDEIFNGCVIDTADGEIFEIVTPTGLYPAVPDQEQIRARLMKELTLVRGIGAVHARRLRGKGYRTLHDLTFHRRFSENAGECIRIICEGRPDEVCGLVSRRFSSSHLLSLLSAGLFDLSSFIFLDLETLGFFSRPIILFGFATIDDGQVVVRQVLVRGINEELPALARVLGYIRKRPVVVSFNGKTFDMPYIVSRAAYYGEEPVYPGHHIDLLHASRRVCRGTTRDCRLSTVEQGILNTSRGMDIPGSIVPEFYEHYLVTGNPGALKPVVGHNYEDVVSLAKLLLHFMEMGYGTG